MYVVYKWIICNEFTSWKKESSLLYDKTSYGSNYLHNQASILNKFVNCQPLKHYFSIKIKTQKHDVKFVMF